MLAMAIEMAKTVAAVIMMLVGLEKSIMVCHPCHQGMKLAWQRAGAALVQPSDPTRAADRRSTKHEQRPLLSAPAAIRRWFQLW